MSHVLVVEDDADLLGLMEMILAEGGYAVRTASDGRQGLARVAEQMPGVILLDMRMPVMSGWEFAREFRSRYGHAAPIVVVTAAENAQERAAEIGAEAWLAKPFELDDVLLLVARLISARPNGGAAAG
jgi:CheY-like chemotaxis protein